MVFNDLVALEIFKSEKILCTFKIQVLSLF